GTGERSGDERQGGGVDGAHGNRRNGTEDGRGWPASAPLRSPFRGFSAQSFERLVQPSGPREAEVRRALAGRRLEDAGAEVEGELERGLGGGELAHPLERQRHVEVRVGAVGVAPRGF